MVNMKHDLYINPYVWHAIVNYNNWGIFNVHYNMYSVDQRYLH